MTNLGVRPQPMAQKPAKTGSVSRDGDHDDDDDDNNFQSDTCE